MENSKRSNSAEPENVVPQRFSLEQLTVAIRNQPAFVVLREVEQMVTGLLATTPGTAELHHDLQKVQALLRGAEGKLEDISRYCFKNWYDAASNSPTYIKRLREVLCFQEPQHAGSVDTTPRGKEIMCYLQGPGVKQYVNNAYKKCVQISSGQNAEKCAHLREKMQLAYDLFHKQISRKKGEEQEKSHAEPTSLRSKFLANILKLFKI